MRNEESRKTKRRGGGGEIKGWVERSCSSLFNGLTGNVESGSVSMRRDGPAPKMKWELNGSTLVEEFLCLQRCVWREVKRRK